jgi:predicted Zn-dependent protease
MIKRRLRQWRRIAIAIAVFWLISNINLRAHSASDTNLPSPKSHPLPQFLADWQNSNDRDYFEQIESTPLGYLIWTQFPVKVYVEQPKSLENSAANKRFQQWVIAVEQAIAQWNEYFPLQIVAQEQKADIIIWRSQPEREIKLNPDTGLYDIPRAVAAQTNYEFYLTKNPAVIALKMTIEISPNFAGESLLATIRHELGHALGIWGHSPKPEDALYFSQVSQPPPISTRDINTLKKIYQQPTRLGWKI